MPFRRTRGVIRATEQRITNAVNRYERQAEDGVDPIAVMNEVVAEAWGNAGRMSAAVYRLNTWIKATEQELEELIRANEANLEAAEEGQEAGWAAPTKHALADFEQTQMRIEFLRHELESYTAMRAQVETALTELQRDAENRTQTARTLRRRHEINQQIAEVGRRTSEIDPRKKRLQEIAQERLREVGGAAHATLSGLHEGNMPGVQVDAAEWKIRVSEVLPVEDRLERARQTAAQNRTLAPPRGVRSLPPPSQVDDLDGLSEGRQGRRSRARGTNREL